MKKLSKGQLNRTALAPDNLSDLINAILDVHERMTAQASQAVNISLTLRNWLIGCYIAEYKLCGSDRASYGDSLLTELASA